MFQISLNDLPLTPSRPKHSPAGIARESPLTAFFTLDTQQPDCRIL